MLIIDELEINEKERKFLIKELYKRFKIMFNENALKKISEAVDDALKRDHTHINEFYITYRQIFDQKSIRTLLKQYRNKPKGKIK